MQIELTKFTIMGIRVLLRRVSKLQPLDAPMIELALAVQESLNEELRSIVFSKTSHVVSRHGSDMEAAIVDLLTIKE